MKKIILSLLIWILAFSGVSAAATPEEQIATLKQGLALQVANLPLEDCRNTLVPIYDLELIELLRFLEIHFQNKSATSSLSNTAIARYSEFKQNIQFHFNQLTPGLEQAAANQNEFVAYEKCSKITDTYLDMGKRSLIDHIKTNSAQKQATLMLEKYKSINNQLRELNLRVSKMYGYFMSFQAKLPGFLQQCITG